MQTVAGILRRSRRAGGVSVEKLESHWSFEGSLSNWDPFRRPQNNRGIDHPRKEGRLLAAYERKVAAAVAAGQEWRNG